MRSAAGKPRRSPGIGGPEMPNGPNPVGFDPR